MKLLAEKAKKEWCNGKYTSNNAHPLVCVRTKLGDILCDQKMTEIVELFNLIDGVETEWSCQGDKTRQAYVVFTGPNSLQLAAFIASHISLGKRKRPGFEHAYNYDLHMFVPTTIELDVQINKNGQEYVRYSFRFPHWQLHLLKILLRYYIRKHR